MDDKIISDEIFYSLIGDKIRFARKIKGIDQESLAKNINLSRTSVINIEKGRQRPSVYQLWLIAQFLEIQVTDLIPPLDIRPRSDEWKEKIDKISELKNDSVKLSLMNFISSSRVNKK